jgi:hypothetical protein
MVPPDPLEEGDRLAVQTDEVLGAVADLGRPARARAPGRALKDEAEPALTGERDIRLVVVAQRLGPGLVLSRSNAANIGRSIPWWKISTVSIPPSVRNRPPSV